MENKSVRCGSYFARVINILLISSVILAGGFLVRSNTGANAEEITAEITVNPVCSFSNGSSSYEREITINHAETINGSAINAICNDPSGYSVYAVGYSGDSFEGNNTDLISSKSSAYNIKTDGSYLGSYWKMKVAVSGDVEIANSFGSYQEIPDSYVKIATYDTSTHNATITPTYEVFMGYSQPSGTYSGKVKYTLVHPSSAAPQA